MEKFDGVITLHGVYKDFHFHPDNNESFHCITYESVRRKIEGKSGFFNIRYNKYSDKFIIFQYILDGEFEIK